MHQIELTDTQAVILSAACAREDGAVFPVTAKLKGAAVGNVCKSLLKRGLIEEVRATDRNTVWRHDEELGSITLRATPLAYEVLGIETERSTTASIGQVDASEATRAADEPGAAPNHDADADTGAHGATGGDTEDAGDTDADAEDDGSSAATAAKPRKTRDGSKQAALIAMLRRPEGATIDEIATAFSWRPHTVRGAIAGALKKKLGLDVTSEKVDGRGRVYKLGT